MKTIDSIICHCSATPEGIDYRLADIDKWHKERGFDGCGYHYIIDLDGTIEKGRPESQNGAHCKGYNNHSIGICYIGGVASTTNSRGKKIAKLDSKGNFISKDTRTPEQKKAMVKLIFELLDRYPTITQILGHRDTSPDKNGDGEITPDEYIKDCPCFDVKAEFPMAVCVANKSK